jgi:hypothetical protein
MLKQTIPAWIRFAFLALATLLAQPAARSADSLEMGFQSPPDSAKPQTWWHWMNGNVTPEGITADLEAMKQIGLGGAEIFNPDCGIPHGAVQFNSPEWHELFKHAVREANRLGLQIEAHNCAGWSSSGGPWNVPSNSMMHVVTSEIHLTGPTNFSGVLPEPPQKLDYYRDIAVLAFRTPDGDEPPSVRPKVTTSAADVDGSPLADGANATTVKLPLPALNHPQFIQFEFPKPFTARIARLTLGSGASNARGMFQVSADGVTFRQCGEFSLSHRPTRPVVFSLGKTAVTARFYRVVFNSLGPDAKEITLRGIEFSPRLRTEDFETKDGETGGFVDGMSSDNRAVDGFGVRHCKIMDLTVQLSADGKLKWKVPAGHWTILRVGFTPSDRKNHPAPPEGTGLECDKFNPAALDAHWAGFMQKLVEDAGPLTGKTFEGSVIDSYEVGGQNWSANFRDEFQRRRGYDPTPFLPAFTGRVVDSPEVTERFLWDVRRTIADLFAENYYGHFTELCHRNGLISSIEPYTGPYESLQCGRPDDIVMGEFWSGSDGGPSVKLAASVAHIYGKQIVGAESFTAAPGAQTGRWLDYPYSLKALGDLEYCTGLNRFVFHRYAMQPWTNRWPGMTMGPWGFHFDRTETWWNQGKAWIDYASRSQFLLQQGTYVADVAYFNGESAPSEMREGNPPLPPGYQFDAINSDVLLHHATVKNGRLNLDGGASYAVLVLPPNDSNLTPPLLARIGDFVRAGLTVVGARPQHSPSLEDYPRCDAQVTLLAKKLWGKCDGKKVTENTVGKGRVAWGKSLDDVFAELKLPPDFTFQGRDANSKILYCHRHLADTEIYFVSNQRQQFESAECSFRCAGLTPELWNPETGAIEPAPVWREENGRTIVPLQFDPSGSVFVVFRTGPLSEHFVSVAHESAASAEPRKPVHLQIIKATYGYFPSGGQTWNDVTGPVKALVAKGTLDIPANNDLAGDDPAPNIVKQLRVDFTLAGRQQSETVEENETLSLPPSAAVTKAVYGKLSTPSQAGQTMDVTEKLTSLVKDGELNVRADNSLAGRDPANLVPKELRVEYSVNGVAKRATVPENEMLTLPESGNAAGAPPVFELGATEQGGTVLRAFEPGNYELQTAAGKNVTAVISPLPAPLEISGDWRLNFPPNWGAPDSVTLDRLISWTDHTNAGVKYFSGTATYEKDIEIPADDLSPGREVWLDLGTVKNFAEVSVNGKYFGVLWKPPFRVNATAAARPGTNSLQVKVTNLWPNRLIGDEQLPADREWKGKQLKAWPQWLLDGQPSPAGRFTFTTWHHWSKDDALLESGLLGPVTLRIAEVKPVQPE